MDKLSIEHLGQALVFPLEQGIGIVHSFYSSEELLVEQESVMMCRKKRCCLFLYLTQLIRPIGRRQHREQSGGSSKQSSTPLVS